VTVDGSSALFPLISQAASDFQAHHPAIQVNVVSSRSQVGRQGVCTGQVDIGMSDVPLTDAEKASWNCQDAVEVPVALQAFAFVTNPTGPGALTSLSPVQLQAIFRGQITNWQELGGDPRPIVIVHRTRGSGTRDVVMGYLFGGDPPDLAQGALEGGNAEVAQALRETPGTIGYLGTAYIDAQAMRVLAIDGVALSPQTVRSGAWPITGRGYLITKGNGSPAAQAFRTALTDVTFQQSRTFAALGYTPVAP
jgi:phosphate transport system substrate-binding protein